MTSVLKPAEPHEVNHTLMNDFVSMPNDEINRYMGMNVGVLF